MIISLIYAGVLSLGLIVSLDGGKANGYTVADCSQVPFEPLLNSQYIKIYAKGQVVLHDGTSSSTMYDGVVFRDDVSAGPPFFGEGILSRSMPGGGSFSWPYEHVVNLGDSHYLTLYYEEGGFVSYLKPQGHRCFVSKDGKEIIFFTGTYMPEGSRTQTASGGFVESWLVRLTGHDGESG